MWWKKLIHYSQFLLRHESLVFIKVQNGDALLCTHNTIEQMFLSNFQLNILKLHKKPQRRLLSQRHRNRYKHINFWKHQKYAKNLMEQPGSEFHRLPSNELLELAFFSKTISIMQSNLRKKYRRSKLYDHVWN